MPCGESLEDSALLAAIESARLFGRVRAYDAPPDPDDRWKPPDWIQFRETTLTALAASRDLRALAGLGVALLRTDGLVAFLQTLPVAAHWLQTYWPDVYPRLDEGDATLRRNTLNCFADRVAIIDAVTRLPLVRSRQHGSFGLREIEIAGGQQVPKDGEAKPEVAQVRAAFADTPADDLQALQQSVSAALASIRAIDAAMEAGAGADAAPSLERLSSTLVRLERAVLAYAPAAAGAEPATQTAGVPDAAGGAQVAMRVGTIQSREEAIRALDAVAEYFRRTEPSSPIPLFVERARRLVAKSFLEVLADLVPDAVPQARSVGGVAEGE
jgi:type VI secretion system protein ImpA